MLNVESFFFSLGNVAFAINCAAGPGFQERCNEYVNDYGMLKVITNYVLHCTLHVISSNLSSILQVSEVISTPAQGRLRCRDVIHAVGPMWALYTGMEERCARVLTRTFTNALFYANNKLKATSIAIPAIGAGKFPFTSRKPSLFSCVVPFFRCVRCSSRLVCTQHARSSDVIRDVSHVTEARHVGRPRHGGSRHDCDHLPAAGSLAARYQHG